MICETESKSAEVRAFLHYMRTGRSLRISESDEITEHKFNQCHDPLNGQFTFGPCASSGSASGLTGRSVSKPAPKPLGRINPSPQPNQAPPGTRPVNQARNRLDARNRIAEMPGYPQTGRTTWRSSNDLAFIAAARFYNRKYGLHPGDSGYRTPAFLKAWAMRESGGEGDERVFRTDPFQVNNAGDWPNDGSKRRIAGLRRNQTMTPAISAYSALEWLRYKASIRDSSGKVIGFRNDRAALERYNGNGARTRQSGTEPHYVWYATSILQMTRQATAQK